MMTLIHWLVVFMYMLPNGYVLGLDCGNNALGMQNNVIPADKITASSGTAGDQARLNNTNGTSWCAMGNDAHPYLQIDLGTPHIICAVATQGHHKAEQWVRTFKLNYSDDGKTYYSYRENGNTQQTFYGNVDGSGIVKQILYQGIIARYLRILPMMHHGVVCMRAEIYGIQIQSENLALNKTADQSSTNYNGTASRAVDGNRDGNWFGGSCTHCNTRHKKEWWRVDLGRSVEVEEVSVFTRTHPEYGLRLWNNTFELHIGITDDGARDEYQSSNPRCGGQYGIIPAGSITIVCNPIRNGRYVTIIQQEKVGSLSLCEVEIYGHVHVENSGSSIRLSEVNCKNTADVVSNKWLMFDLGQMIPIYKVYMESYYNYDILNVFEIRIGNGGLNGGSATRPIINFGRATAHTSGKRHGIVLIPVMMGRYLAFKKRPGVSSHRLCIVEVYSKAPICGRQGIGISNNQVISDNKLKATSIHSDTRSAAKARLLGDSSWRPRDDDPNPWLQIDLDEIYYVCAVATQGDPNSDERTKLYKLKWTLDNVTWDFVRNETSKDIMIFTGNRDRSSIIKHIFTTPLKAKMIQFYPVEKKQAYALRVEVYGVNIQGPLAPNGIGDIVLDPRYKSHVDLVCKAEQGMNIKWYHNDTDITSYSIGTVRTGSILRSTLRVNYTSADDVYDKYSCDEAKRHCTSLDYICQIDYGSYRKLQSRGKITTLLVPTRPRNLNATVNPQRGNNRPTVTLKWEKPVRVIGNITGYTLFSNYVIDNVSKMTSLIITDFTSMSYTTDVIGGVRIGLYLRARDSDLIGDPSETWTANIQECKPSSAPAKVKVTKSDKGKYEVSWQEIPRELSNGKVIAYEVKWSSIASRKRRSSVVPHAANASESPYMLVNISLADNMKYNIIVRGYTEAGPGPYSDPIVLEKERAEGRNQDKVSDSVIAVAVLFSIFFVFAVGIVFYIFWYKKRRGEELVILGRTICGTSNKNSPQEASAEGQETNYLVPVDRRQGEEKQQGEENIEMAEIECDAVYENKTEIIGINQFPDFMARARRKKYELLMHQFKVLPQGRLYPCTVASKPTNKQKNRYGNIIPYDNSRVVLEKIEEEEESDYINASYIRGYDCKQISYIAAQGPLVQTVDDFWRMIWQEKTSVIVMLTGIREHNKTKCEKYWPENSKTYQDLSVHLQKTEVFADYSIRTLVVSKMKTREQRYIFQYHFTAWPDKGVPQYATQLLAFRRRLASDTAMGSPWVVHCSAGIGRTGTFLAIDAMIRQAQENKTIDVVNFVKIMRQNRQNMVQTKEQYLFIHMAILEHLTCGITEIQAHQLRKKINKLTINDRKKKITGFEKEFKHLSSLCHEVHKDETKNGSKSCNSKKNRFQDILPLDKARVILQTDTEKEGTDYINASYANGYRQKDAYILTQAPLDTTIADFWKMIYDNKLGTVVMLNTCEEEQMSYPTYWPEKETLQFGNITVEIVHEETEKSIVSREFNLTHNSDDSNKAHKVRHLQHTEWFDGSVQTTTTSVLGLVEKIQRAQQQSANKPIVVQCSDGVGRSGTLCTILSLLDRVKTEQMVDVFQTVKALRISRPGAVETAIQYQFCFQVVMDYLESFSDYSNFNG